VEIKLWKFIHALSSRADEDVLQKERKKLFDNRKNGEKESDFNKIDKTYIVF